MYGMLKQFIPSDYCLKCLGCCRFAQNPTIWAPQGCKLIQNNNSYICEQLNLKNNRCEIYRKRPLDCRLYPFLLVKRNHLLQLGLHKSCCFIEENKPDSGIVREYADYLKRRLNGEEYIAELRKNPQIAADYQEDVEILTNDALLNKLTLKNKPLIDSYLKKNKTHISAYSFAGIFIWQGLFKIFWVIIEKSLAIFYQDKIGMFMPLAPLGKCNVAVIGRCFEIMRFYNKNSEVSRIENVAEEDLELYSKGGFRPKLKDREYICLKKKLVELAGDSFKPKRSGYNQFSKKYTFKFLKYQPSMSGDCLKLYRLWMAWRDEKSQDSIYQQMLTDSFISFKTALKFYQELDLSGYVVKINAEIKACSLGYPLNKETFCVLFEVCDLNLKGIAQFIFREFCKRLSAYKYINIMGESDLENLKKVKLSYRPVKEIKVYNIYEKI